MEKGNESTINVMERGLGWLDKALSIVEKYRIKTLFKAFGILLLIAAFIGFIKNPTWVFEQYESWKEKQHTEALEVRLVNNEKLHVSCEKLLYKVQADRVMVLELHNGLENSVGLPFSKCSATYEALEMNVQPVADQYQNVNLSLMPFATLIFEQGYWCGDVEDIAKVDRGLYYKMKANGTEHFAACLIEGVDKPLAFLFVSYRIPANEEHNCSMVRENIRHIALEQALLLELNKHHNKNK